MKSLLNQCAEKNELEILSLSIQPGHVHLFVSAPLRFSPAKLINLYLFKGLTARELRKRHQHLISTSSAPSEAKIALEDGLTMLERRELLAKKQFNNTFPNISECQNE